MSPLNIPKSELGKHSPIPVTVLQDSDEVVTKFASDFLHDYQTAKDKGRDKVVFILPVGPVGQYDIVAETCNAKRISLSDLVIINMDEYLTPDGSEWISMEDPLSFRRHMEDHFYRKLDPELSPRLEHRVFPHPTRTEEVQALIDRWGGVDVSYCGVGINGHLAFNDPPEPGEDISTDAFRQLPTRVVKLTRETRLINSVTAARGNIDRIPPLAITVGMKEVLESRKVRVYMNRVWQCAIVRKILYGPVGVAVPASLLREHGDVRFVVADFVTDLPEPALK
ncbi:MAG: glucosamine-6-phosphate isomerase [Xanthomonadales bacterium]|nr:glucosamine-6-phosphate isomerase [Xanthomonadales bacterium]